MPRGTAVYGGGSAIDTPIVAARDSFYFLPTHELNAGVALVAYRVSNTPPHDRLKPADVLKEKMTAGEAKALKDANWDWDTLDTDRLKGTLAGLPENVLGTRRRPDLEAGEAAAKSFTDAQLDEIILTPTPRLPATPSPHHARLAKAVEELISQPYRPLLFPAGKHPAEAYRLFTEPTETLYTLALAYPHLPPDLQTRVKAHVTRLQQPGGPLAPPTGVESHDATAGTIRSAYDEPPARLLKMGREVTRATTARLHPLYLWAQVTGDWTKLQRDWPEIKKLLASEPARPLASLPDLGNARLSTAIAAARLSQKFDDPTTAATYLAAARALCRERIAYEHAHTRGGLITAAPQRSLIGRWHHLDGDLARLLRATSLDVNRHLMSLYIDHHRPAWHVAWNVELLWRNENPFSFPDMSADVFAAKALILNEPADALAKSVDVPWCEGDEYYVQKLALLCARSRND